MERLTNFRDLGGIIAVDGKKIRPKRLMRSGEVNNLPDSDKKCLLEDYKLKLLVDFRTRAETQQTPDDVLPDVEYLHIDIMEDAEDKASTFENFESITDEKQARAFMQQVYGITVTDRNAQNGYALFLRRVIENQAGSVLFHCFAGKDRTGTGAAIVLTLLGVGREAIFADYLKTNESRAAANEAILEMERKAGKSEQALTVIKEFLQVEREYLQHVFDITEKQYGSFDAYIRETMGITDEDIASLRTNYLE